MAAGMINKEWLSDARDNESEDRTVEQLFAQYGNWETVEIEPSGNVYVEAYGSGRWLDQTDVDLCCEAVDGGLI